MPHDQRGSCLVGQASGGQGVVGSPSPPQPWQVSHPPVKVLARAHTPVTSLHSTSLNDP